MSEKKLVLIRYLFQNICPTNSNYKIAYTLYSYPIHITVLILYKLSTEQNVVPCKEIRIFTCVLFKFCKCVTNQLENWLER